MSQAVLITGATGKQGGALISALFSLRDSPFRTQFALTRDPDSPAAKALVAKYASTVSTVKGNLDDPDAIFRAVGCYGSISAVFSVQPSMGPSASWKIEERQGKALIDAAIKFGVSHFVYTSVDRSGARSDNNPTNVSHFSSKHRIEGHLREATAATGSKMSWTILRPTAFFEDLNPGFPGKLFATAWKSRLPINKRLQFVATADIGWFAAQALSSPSRWDHRVLSLAGDELTFVEANNTFQSVTGRSAGIPLTSSIVTSVLVTTVNDLKMMFQFFAEEGYNADIQELREMKPTLMDWRAWLQQSVYVQ
jgi:uncharacterized protein YbjT (DUF2867 family)